MTPAPPGAHRLHDLQDFNAGDGDSGPSYPHRQLRGWTGGWFISSFQNTMLQTKVPLHLPQMTTPIVHFEGPRVACRERNLAVVPFRKRDLYRE